MFLVSSYLNNYCGHISHCSGTSGCCHCTGLCLLQEGKKVCIYLFYESYLTFGRCVYVQSSTNMTVYYSANDHFIQGQSSQFLKEQVIRTS